MLEGAKVTLAGTEYTVPPLNLKALRTLMPQIGLLSAFAMSDAHVDAAIKVLHAAMVRNYPAMSEDDVADLIDLGNLQVVIEAVMNVSGLAKGAQPSVEAPAAP